MGISIWQLLIVLGIVILLFGTKKLRNIGSDLGVSVSDVRHIVDIENRGRDEEGRISHIPPSYAPLSSHAR